MTISAVERTRMPCAHRRASLARASAGNGRAEGNPRPHMGIRAAQSGPDFLFSRQPTGTSLNRHMTELRRRRDGADERKTLVICVELMAITHGVTPCAANACVTWLR
jgi:hypothetical protein